MTHPDAKRAFEEMMPEPFGYVSDGGLQYMQFQHKPWSQEHQLLHSTGPVYSQAQLRTAMQAVWDAATERAAKEERERAEFLPLYSTRMKAKRYDWLLAKYSTCTAGDAMNPAVAKVTFTRFYPGSIGERPSLDTAIDDDMQAATAIRSSGREG